MAENQVKNWIMGITAGVLVTALGGWLLQAPAKHDEQVADLARLEVRVAELEKDMALIWKYYIWPKK